MNEFFSFLILGIEHIISFPEGYDHLLFILALSAVYAFKEWKTVLILVTSFTIGHSVTLLITVLDYSPIPSLVIEWLIPLSILCVCVLNFFTKTSEYEKAITPNLLRRYIVALVFGLIHGLGFANYFREMLPDNLFVPLLAANLGLEVAQLIIVFIGLSVGFLLMTYLKISQNRWKMVLSAIVFCFALHLFAKHTLALFA